jgi:HIP---CoA ligase
MRGDQEWGTIPRLVRSSAERFPDVEALVDGDLRLTFPQLAVEVDRAARALIASGVEPGDRVAVWAPNIAEWVVAALGIHSAGAVLIPLNTRFKGREAAYILERSRAKLLVTVTGFLDTDYVGLLRTAAGGPVDGRPTRDLPGLQEIVVLRGDVPKGCIAWADVVARADQVDPATSEARAQAVTPDDLCHILFTSGTTGLPKGAMLPHGAVLRAFAAWSEVVGLREGDRYLIINPYFHAFGLNSGILACLMAGATNIPQPVFDVPAVMRRVVEERISMLPGPPTIYQTILNHPDLASFDMSTLRRAVTGAAAVPVEMIRRMRKELTFETIVTGYGLTETCGIVTMCRHDDDPETIANTSGRAIPDVEVLVVDDDGKEVPRGEPGEIVVRGYNLMVGYLDDPEETAATIDADGWLHTGDIGTMDDRGYIVITDRKKDMYITGGFNAYPAEIEGALVRHPAIAAAAVVGVPDERMGEVGWAFVIPRSGTEVDPDEVVAWARDEVANFKVPRRVVVVDAFPLNASGKVLKYELRDRAVAALAAG